MSIALAEAISSTLRSKCMRVRPALDQEQVLAGQNQFVFLDEGFASLNDDSVVRPLASVPFLLNRDRDADCIFDEHGSNEAKSIVAAEHVMRIDYVRSQGGTYAEYQGSMGDAAAKRLRSAPLLIHVVRIEIPCLACAEHDAVRVILPKTNLLRCSQISGTGQSVAGALHCLWSSLSKLHCHASMSQSDGNGFSAIGKLHVNYLWNLHVTGRVRLESERSGAIVPTAFDAHIFAALMPVT